MALTVASTPWLFTLAARVTRRVRGEVDRLVDRHAVEERRQRADGCELREPWGSSNGPAGTTIKSALAPGARWPRSATPAERGPSTQAARSARSRLMAWLGWKLAASGHPGPRRVTAAAMPGQESGGSTGASVPSGISAPARSRSPSGNAIVARAPQARRAASASLRRWQGCTEAATPSAAKREHVGRVDELGVLDAVRASRHGGGSWPARRAPPARQRRRSRGPGWRCRPRRAGGEGCERVVVPQAHAERSGRGWPGGDIRLVRLEQRGGAPPERAVREDLQPPVAVAALIRALDLPCRCGSPSRSPTRAAPLGRWR